jgi:heparan-alpha-glucosaminide N-acetyltransferase
MQNTLTTQRVLSVDAFRGITILVMIFVNELAGVKNIPVWMKHMPADADAMTFVDAVFPAFLFIVGMSIPFAINNRISKGDDAWQVQKHILIRTIGLLVLGVFMVNAEDGYNETAMHMSIHLWALMFYVCVILVWNVYSFKQKTIPFILRIIGVGGLLILAFIYRGGEDGSEHLKPHWWGILGLIGWAYFIASLLYQLLKGKVFSLVIMIGVCVAYYAISKNEAIRTSAFSLLFSQAGHASHITIVLCGVVVSQLFFDEVVSKTPNRKFKEVFLFAVILIIGGLLLRPYYHISKIHATPTWSLYSAASCSIIISFLYWLVDLRKINSWITFFKPAASNPLLTYIIPFIVYAFLGLFNVHLPAFLFDGFVGILWSISFAVAVMAVVILLNKLSIKLQL